MSYDTNRDDEQIEQVNHAIDDFVSRYNESSATPANRQTVILFPGGMGSRLIRADAPYVDGAPEPQKFTYSTVWLTPATLVWDAPLLQLSKTPLTPEYRDTENRFIVADGEVGFAECTPYDEFSDWCDQKNLDWFIFGWDWRRRLDDSVGFFLDRFLPHLKQRVFDGCHGADPLANFSLIGHSSGGMVVNWILRTEHPLCAGMRYAITAATPFYGYAAQVHRWFEGESLLNGPFHIHRLKIIKTVSSLPGCYALHFMTEAMWNDNQAALGNDPLYPLHNYPSTDATTGVIADPYNPKTYGSYVRYPTSARTGFDKDELANGKNVVEFLASPLPGYLANKFYNIRGVRTNDAKTGIGSTTWGWLDPLTFEPTPIKDGVNVPGDDTQPAWTTHLVRLPANHRRTVTGPHINHMFLMNCPETLAELGTLLGV